MTDATQEAPAPAPRPLEAPPDHFMWRYLVSMVMEPKDGAWCLSIGRVLLLTVFVHSVVVWSMHQDIPDHEMATMGGLLAYVLGSKLAGVAENWRRS